MAKRQSYAKTLKQAMREKNIDTQELATLTKRYDDSGYGYEHIRKILMGHPSVGENCNELLCKILGLDAEELWALATQEKIERRFGRQPLGMVSPDNARMRAVWNQLDAGEQERLLRAAEGYVAQRTLDVHALTKNETTRQLSALTRHLAELNAGHEPAQPVTARTFGAKRKRHR